MNLEDLYRLLRTEHVQAQGIVDTLNEPLLVVDQAGCVLSANRVFYETFRVGRDETVGKNLFALGDGQWNIAELRQLIGNIIPRSAAILGYEVTTDFPTIGRRTILVSARRLVHPDNNSNSIFVLFEDVTDRRVHETQNEILFAETRHRMKNLLGIVRSLARQTEVDGRSAQDYRDAFLGRLQALAEAEDLTLLSDAPAELRALLQRAVKPAGADRCRIAPAPAVALNRRQVVPMSLILHELVTNALKYGALSRSDGVVTIAWSLEERDGKNVLQIDWREENGPAVTPPARTGYGSKLIHISAVHGLRGTVETKYEPTGLQVRISVPMEA